MPEAGSDIRELCEEYSLLIRHIDLLRRNNTQVSLISEYEELARFLEDDVAKQYLVAISRSFPSIGRGNVGAQAPVRFERTSNLQRDPNEAPQD